MEEKTEIDAKSEIIYELMSMEGFDPNIYFEDLMDQLHDALITKSPEVEIVFEKLKTVSQFIEVEDGGGDDDGEPLPIPEPMAAPIGVAL